MPTYYAAVRSGDRYDETDLHEAFLCDAIDDDAPTPRPVTVAEDRDDLRYCGECTDRENAPETCDVIKNDGEVCGRERPCPYHD